MAKQTDESPREQVVETSTTRDNIRWMIGFIILATGLFIFCSILSYFFYWQEDMSALNPQSVDPRIPVTFHNVCGGVGAGVADSMVGRGFGLFALVIPVVVSVVGWRIFRYKPLRLNHFALSSMLVLLLGSLTLGYLFGMRWNPFGSGLGGEYGIAMCRWLSSKIGGVGTLLLIVAGWILTGVFINRNFINKVNSAGETVADSGERIVMSLWARLRAGRKSAGAAVAETPADAGRQTPAAAGSGDTAVAAGTAAEQPAELHPESRPQHVGTAGSADEDRIVIRAVPVDAPAEPEQNAEPEPESEPESPFVSEPVHEDIAAEHPAVESNSYNPFEPQPDPGTDDGELRMVVVPGVSAAEASELLASQSPVTGDAAAMTIDTHADEDRDEQPTHSDAETVQTPRTDAAGGMVITVEANEAQRVDENDIDGDLYDPMRDLFFYRAPVPSLLVDYKSKTEIDEREILENKEKIRETLQNFGIPIVNMHATVGPTVTLYEMVQAQGVKISKIQGLENDIAQSLKALGIRIIAPIPGRGTIGIEVPNRSKQIVSMYSAICSKEFQSSTAELPVVVGRTIQNENFTFDLAKMPHLLVAGATGQGKSVGLNAIITSLLYRKHPAQLKFVLIDPKMVEFSLYAKLEKHFLAKMESEDDAVVTDPKKAVYTLNALCTEMGNRLELCKMAGARNIAEYNEKFLNRRLNPQKGHKFMPYIVVVIDEFADLIMTAKEVEGPVMRLAQKARAIGIHLIVATQRPDVKVITGGIKANFPARIAFRVMQMTDSRTIIDQPGANQLIGKGDMLLSKDGELTRIQCALVETAEVKKIVDYIAQQQGYTSAYPLPDYTPDAGGDSSSSGFGGDSSDAPVKYDPMFGEIARAAVSGGQISVSMIQRNYNVGFNRAGRIMMQLERAGIVGRQEGSKPREIKFYDMPSLEAKLQDLGVS